MNIAKAEIIGGIIESELGISLSVIRGKGRKPSECTARTVFIALNELAGGFQAAVAAEYLSRSVEEINHIRRQHTAWNKTNLEYSKTFEMVRIGFKAHLPDLNDIELSETRAELEHHLWNTQMKLAKVIAQQIIRKKI